MESLRPADEIAAAPLLARAARLSHYARRLIESGPAWSLDAGLDQPFRRDEMLAALAALSATDEESLWRALRILRQRVMLRLIARDLGGLAPLTEVFETTTALAEVTISHALGHLHEWLAARHGQPVGAASGSPSSGT